MNDVDMAFRRFQRSIAISLVLLFALAFVSLTNIGYDYHEIQTTEYNDTTEGLFVDNELVKGEIVSYEDGILTYRTYQTDATIGYVVWGLFICLVLSLIPLLFSVLNLMMEVRNSPDYEHRSVKPTNRTKHIIGLVVCIILVITSICVMFYMVDNYIVPHEAQVQDFTFNDGTLTINGETIENTHIKMYDGNILHYNSDVPSEILIMILYLMPILMVVSLLGCLINWVELSEGEQAQ